MKKSFFAELAIVCFFLSAVLARSPRTTKKTSATLVLALAAVVSSIVFVVSLIAEAKKLGLKA